MKLFLVIPSQGFATSFRNVVEPRVNFTADGNPKPIEVYLLEFQSSTLNPPSSSWPFLYKTASGNASLTATATLFSASSIPVTLTVPVQLSSAPALHCFTGTLSLDTVEIAALFGSGRSSIEVLFSLEVTNGIGETVESFQAPVTIRLAPGVTAPTAVTQLSGVGDDLVVSAAGTTDLVPGRSFIQWFQKISATAGAGAYVHKLTLDRTPVVALEGATFRVEIDIPATANPVIEIYDEDVSGAPLESIPGDSDNATKYRFEAVFHDGHWEKDNGEYL